MHGLRQREVTETLVEIADVVRCRAGTVGLVDDELGSVVQSLDSAVVDGHAEVIQGVVLMAA